MQWNTSAIPALLTRETGNRIGIQGNPWQHRELKTGQEYMSPYLRKKSRDRKAKAKNIAETKQCSMITQKKLTVFVLTVKKC